MKKRKNLIKVVFFSRLYYPHIGGVEKHTDKISSLLVKKGFDVTIICEQHDKKLKTEEEIKGIKIVRIPIGSSEKKKKFLVWKWMIKNRNYIKDFDIIHIHDVFFWILPLIFWLQRRKVFVTFHGYEAYPVGLSSKIQKKIAAKYCSGSISVGEFINKWYAVASNFIIYGGVEKPKKPSYYPKNKKSAIFFGRLDSQTGIKEYYEAYLKLKKKYGSFRFAVIGEGEYLKKIKKVSSISPFKSNLINDIRQNRFVFVSRYLSMLEVMVEKRLIFAVYTDPIKKDYLVNSPFSKYVEVCSSDSEVVDRINFYMNNPKEESKKIEAAYKWASEQNWNKIVNVYKTLWKI